MFGKMEFLYKCLWLFFFLIYSKLHLLESRQEWRSSRCWPLTHVKLTHLEEISPSPYDFASLKICKSKKSGSLHCRLGDPKKNFHFALVLSRGNIPTHYPWKKSRYVPKPHANCCMPIWKFPSWNSLGTTVGWNRFCRIPWCTPTASVVRHLEVSEGKYERK